MDVTGLTSLATASNQSGTADAINVRVLKKAMDMEVQSALQLLQTLPRPANNPPHLGQNVDVKA